MTSTAQEFDCVQCGSHLSYEPGQQSLSCQYCNYENKIEGAEKPAFIEENDLEAYLVSREQRAETIRVKTIRCSSCGAETTLDNNIQSSTCPFCATPIVLEQSTESNLVAPEYLLPFDLKEGQAEERFIQWIKSLWFAPNELKKRVNSAQKMKGMYLPFWTYDANTSTHYTGQRGDHYYVTQRTGKSSTRVRKTRWTPTFGNVFHSFDDVLVAGTKSLPTKKLEALEPWNLESLRSYEQSYLVGFTTEQHSVSLEEGLGSAKEKMVRKIDRLIRRDIGGDEQRILSKHVRYSNIQFKHILLPTWVSSYRYKEKAYQILVNARTGEVQAERPWSWVKIAALAVTVAVLIAAAVWYLQGA